MSQGTKIIAAFAVIYLVWGSTFLATRIGVLEMPPLLFAAGRFTIAGTLLAGAALVLRESFPRTRREWLHAGLFSILMVPMSNGLSTVAVRHVPSKRPPCSPRARRSGLRARRDRAARSHAGTGSMLGLSLGPRGWSRCGPHQAGTRHLGWRALLLFSSMNFIASIVYRDAQLVVGPMAFNATIMLLGALCLAIVGVITGEPSRWRWSGTGIWAMLYLALFGSALAYTSYTWLLKRAPADRVGTFAYVNPAIATVLGWAVLGEALTRVQLLGVLVILAGVAMVTFASGR